MTAEQNKASGNLRPEAANLLANATDEDRALYWQGRYDEAADEIERLSGELRTLQTWRNADVETFQAQRDEVERLRRALQGPDYEPPQYLPAVARIVDLEAEVERLRAEVERLRHEVQVLWKANMAQTDVIRERDAVIRERDTEVERLREVMRSIADDAADDPDTEWVATRLHEGAPWEVLGDE